MADSGAAYGPGRALRILAAARWLLALVLAFGALSFLVHGRGAFARFGRPDEARIALASAELAGSVLFLFRRTARAGAIVLVVVLAWAAGFHFALGLGAVNLWLYLVAVLALRASIGLRFGQSV